MKKVMTISLILMLPVISWSQQVTKFYETLEKKGYANQEVSYIFQMKTAAKALDNCSKTKCELTDPVKDKTASAKEQIKLVSTLGVYPSRSVQKSMAKFEKQLLGHKKFPKAKLEMAFKKHAGYSFDAMSSRMDFYIKSMESIEDDE